MKMQLIVYYDLLAKDLLNEWTVNAGEEKHYYIIEIPNWQLRSWLSEYDGITQDKIYDYLEDNYHEEMHEFDDKVVDDIYYLVSGTNFEIID